VSGSVRQVTKTKDPVDAQGISLKPTNRFTFGRRMSRDGRYIGLESMATDPKANATSALDFRVTFVYDAVSDTFAQLGPRPTTTTGTDVFPTFPTFTDYTGTSPGTVLFSSLSNFKSDGTLITSDTDTTGLNNGHISQVFATSLPVQATGPFTRITNVQGTGAAAVLNPLASNSRRRIAFSYGG